MANETLTVGQVAELVRGEGVDVARFWGAAAGGDMVPMSVVRVRLVCYALNTAADTGVDFAEAARCMDDEPGEVMASIDGLTRADLSAFVADAQGTTQSS